MNDIASRLLQYENDGKRKEAVRDFLEAVKDSDQPGKWQMIVDALEEVGVCVGRLPLGVGGGGGGCVSVCNILAE